MESERVHTNDSDLIILSLYGVFAVYQICLITAVIACLVHSYTSPVLVKNLPNSYPPHTRPVYQAGSITRSSFIKNVDSPFVYAESVLGAALIAVSHCHGPWPVPAYLVLVHFLWKLSLWSRLPEPLLIKALRRAGFSTRKVHTNPSSIPSIGYLPMDQIRIKWAEL
ncbi:hypothetical protein BDV29DRAFT_188860 [Aspergillus leporis]|uniref:Uncharacterized protein n=1 Tax=Aspergillus leporis TaxID=41062 RepID=A0A5N5X916_9EURO|nr:hypothetical protein BDV29DRAFT_188860 [Aspergillus leporis]